MPLSLTSIYRPLNDFFLQIFPDVPGDELAFRFDRLGSMLSDEDFYGPGGVAAGYSQVVARELFSDLVNRIPVDANDNVNVLLSGDSIDSHYFYRLLAPALPVLPAGVDDITRESMVNSFNTVKSAATARWEQITLESASGLVLDFKPADATPNDWFDPGNHAIWTNFSYSVQEEEQEPDSDTGLWKMKLDPEILDSVIEVLPQPEPIPPEEPDPRYEHLALGLRLLELAANPEIFAVNNLSRAANRPFLFREEALDPLQIEAHRLEVDQTYRHYEEVLGGLTVKNRIDVANYVFTDVKTTPSEATSLDISLSYCIVRIARPWYFDVFIRTTNWGIPGVAAGQLSASSGNGGLSWLPIGMVVVKDLRIHANWSERDIQAASNATGFGPFKVDEQVVDGNLSHAGIQVIGWLLQRLPALPPATFVS